MQNEGIFARIVNRRRPDITVIRKLMPISAQSLIELVDREKETFDILCQIISVHLGGTDVRTLDEKLADNMSFKDSKSIHAFGSLTKTTGTETYHKDIARDIRMYYDVDTKYEYAMFNKYLFTIELLHEISLKSTLKQINRPSETQSPTSLTGFVQAKPDDETILTAWPSSIIDHHRYGIHEAGYIPLIGLMISHKVPQSNDLSWSVAFFIRNDIQDLKTPLETNIRDDIKRYYDSLNEDATRILMIFGVKMGADYGGMYHVLCVLIVREQGKTPFITLLDNTWHDPEHNEYHEYYVNLMIEISGLLKFTNKTLAVPIGCKNWISKTTTTRSTRRGSITQNPYKDVDFLDIQSISHEWLREALTNPVQPGIVDSKALICPYHAALHILSCIKMETFDRKELRDLTWEVRYLIDQINTEMLICVLAGCFTLTPVSVRKALVKMNVSGIEAFHVIDNSTCPPSDVYTWAISHSRTPLTTDKIMSDRTERIDEQEESDEEHTVPLKEEDELFGGFARQLNVNILGHYPRNATTTIFEWSKSIHDNYNYTSGSIQPLLEILHKEATTFKSTASVRIDLGKRKGTRTQLDLLDKITNLLLRQEI